VLRAQSATAQSAATRSQHRRRRWGGADQGAGPSWQLAPGAMAQRRQRELAVAQKQRVEKKKMVFCVCFFLFMSGSNRQRDELPVVAFV
jgi:hypothetical protein